jgi:hypothetical protein
VGRRHLLEDEVSDNEFDGIIEGEELDLNTYDDLLVFRKSEVYSTLNSLLSIVALSLLLLVLVAVVPVTLLIWRAVL